MKKLIKPASVNGIIKAPSSKSIVQRAIAMALLAKGRSVISNVTFCDDVLSAVNAARAFGASVTLREDSIIIESNGLHAIKDRKNIVVNCGESALCLRMFSAISAILENSVVLTGEKTLLNRSVGMIESSLRNFGVQCSSDNGRPPLKIKGPIKLKNLNIDASSTSQFLTGLLIALSSTGEEYAISVENFSSKPYADITVGLLEKSGVKITNCNYNRFEIAASEISPFSIYAEGDWSGAAFIAVAGAICGNIRITGLDTESLQGDKAILKYLEEAGAKVFVDNTGISVTKRELKGFKADCTDVPDLFMPLTALAAYCHGKSVIHGVHRLRGKESDRATSLVSEFSELGTDIVISNDDLIITGGKVNGAEVFSHNDHRVAMALAVTALRALSDVTIVSVECVDKSWPGFFETLSYLGGEIS